MIALFLFAVAATAATCPTRLFPSVSAFSAGASYPAPSMSVSCSATQATVTSNNIPPYTFVAKTPNPLTAQSFSLSFTLSPVEQSSPTTIVNILGVLGVTTTGIEIFGPVRGRRLIALSLNVFFSDPVFRLKGLSRRPRRMETLSRTDCWTTAADTLRRAEFITTTHLLQQ